MTNQEFSNEFDILYNNIASNMAPGLDEYEKSVFLTKAQEDIVLSYYSGANPTGDSFEKTEESRRFLSNLMKTVNLSPVGNPETIERGISSNSYFFNKPEDLWFITYEAVDFTPYEGMCGDGKDIRVVPITQDDFARVSKNPFRTTTNNRVLRLDTDKEYLEIVSKNKISNYLMAYISKPTPIILEDLKPLDVSIDGKTDYMECKLNPVLHRAILDRAVQLAFMSINLGTGSK